MHLLTRSMLLATMPLAALLAPCVLAGGPESRLVDEPPEQGRFVNTDRGFMVPYQQRIPGSDAVIEMVPVPGGTILLAPLPVSQDEPSADQPSPSPANARASGTKEVTFGPFWIGKYEITMRQYMPYRRLYYQQREAQAERARMKNSKDDEIKLTDVDAVTGPTEVYDTGFNFEYAEAPDSPVPTASQFATRQYTKWLSLIADQTYRLPQRAEWQHACLAGSRSKYCFGDDEKQLKDYAVFVGSALDDPLTLRVGTKQPNAWGLFDVHGNVSEYVIEESATRGKQYGHVACGGNAESEFEECRFDSVIRSTEDWWDQDPDLPRSAWWATSEESRVTGFRIISPLKPMSESEKRTAWEPDSEDLVRDVQVRIQDGRGSIGRVTPPHPTTRIIE